MESKYKSIKHIGEGAFSSVILALNVETGDKVAIKKMKKRRWKDTAAQAEISALQKLHHENIIRLLDVFREDYRSFLVFECMDCDLNELVVSRNGRRLPDTVILDITYQVLNGLDFIHRNSLFHRDIKPENVLIRRHITPGGPGGNSSIVVEAKIADFGLVHDLDFSRPLTDYISTRWYRAPEVLLNCTDYSTPIDVWAVGTIISELATLRPLFPGSNQIDQLRRIFEVLGTPRISAPTPGAYTNDEDNNASDAWYEGAVHARKLGIAFVPSQRKPLHTVLPDVSSALTQLIDYLLVLNPAARPTAHDGLMLVSSMLDQHLGEPQADDARVPAGGNIRHAENEIQAVPNTAHSSAAESDEEQAAAAEQVPPPAEQPKRHSEDRAPPMAMQDSISPSFGPVPNEAHASQPEPEPEPEPEPLPSVAKPKASDESMHNLELRAEPAQVAQTRAVVQDGRISFTQPKQLAFEKTAKSPISVSSSRTSSFVSIVGAEQQVKREPAKVKIVQNLHKEPIHDPRADLSDLAVKPTAAMPAVVAGTARAMARRIVLPHMRATTPVSASVPAPQIVPRGANGSRQHSDQPDEDGYVSVEAASMGMPASMRRDNRPPRLGIKQDTRVSTLRGRSQSVATEASLGGGGQYGQSIVLSPTSTGMREQSRGSEAFSISDIPSPIRETSTAAVQSAGLRIYNETQSAIGKTSLMSMLAQEDPQGSQAAKTSGKRLQKSACETAEHIRKAPGVASPAQNAAVRTGKADKRKSELWAGDFVPLPSPANSSAPFQSMAPAKATAPAKSPALAAQALLAPAAGQGVPTNSPAATNGQQQPKSSGKQGRLLGLRSKGGLGSPLIRRALSMKKKGAQRTNEATPPLPQSPAPAQAGGGLLLTVGDISGQLDLSAETQAALDERIRDTTASKAEPDRAPSRARKDEWINNTQYLRQRLTVGKTGEVGFNTVAGMRRQSAAGEGGWLGRPVSKPEADSDYLGVQAAVTELLKSANGEDAETIRAEAQQLLSGLDSFTPVTLDANTLFQQSHLASSPGAADTGSPASMMSPADYMATFSDIRRKYSESRNAEAAAAAAVVSGGEHAGAHRFLSKVKNALIGGRHAQTSQPRGRNLSSHGHGGAVQRSSSDAASARPRDCAPPRLDFDLGTSLLTPESLHNQRLHDETTGSMSLSTSQESSQDYAKASTPVGNDSAYYLIDYIMAQDGDTQPGLSASRPAARRIVNMSTRARQTQYEYNYGSQIFECLDKDFVLLKTDLFNDIPMHAPPSAAAAAVRSDKSSAGTTSTRPRKRPADVTAATAYTAAAINSIVAHNAKARSQLSNTQLTA
ncbi:hypothetical protein LPJ78_001948 [Coemansia sp. RSA 989]|nr:hypothetical protein LPJ68_003432 [Coemansia sp. RSA 1086]KAJ1866291.1 hypothetical protein LPJ78_001948 [Coemansia sp. RSA 989]KAJ1872461.1 hypothetical protein LPJ55_003079 [Coemansia sp. RSA 990]